MVRYGMATLMAALLLASCATTYEIPVRYNKPSTNQELANISRDIIVAPAFIQEKAEGSDTPGISQVLEQLQSTERWNKIELKQTLDTMSQSQVQYLQQNSFLKVRDLQAVVPELSAFEGQRASLAGSQLLITRIFRLYTRIFDESYTNSNKTGIGYFRTYQEGEFVTYIYDIASGTLQAGIPFKQNLSDYSSSYEAANDKATALASQMFLEATRQAEQQLAPYTVNETRLLLIPGSNELFANGKLLVKKKKLADATRLFLDCHKDSGIWEAGYNAALLLEAQGKFSDALALLKTLAPAKRPEVDKEIAFLESLDLGIQQAAPPDQAAGK